MADLIKHPGSPTQLLIRRQWVDALRSGKYKQATGRLRKDGGFCCLGVLCDVVAPEDWRAEPVSEAAFSMDDAAYALPARITEQAGMLESGGQLVAPIDGSESLWELNDCRGFTFARIADVIEQQFDVAPPAQEATNAGL